MSYAFARETRIMPSQAGVANGFTVELEAVYTGPDVPGNFLSLIVQAEIPPAATAQDISNAIDAAVRQGGADRGVPVTRSVIPAWTRG